MEMKRVSAVSPRFSRSVMAASKTIENFTRQQVAQLATIALGERRHDHLIGGARAGDEVLGIKARIRHHDGIEPAARPTRSRRCPSSVRSTAAPLGRPRRRFGCRDGKVTTLSLAGLRNTSRAEYGS